MVEDRAGMLEHIFFPAKCCCCGGFTRGRAYICDRCRASLPLIPSPVCRLCGETAANCRCGEVKPFCDGCVSPFYNRGTARDGVYGIKQRGEVTGARLFGTYVAERFAEVFPDVRPDAVTAVPMTRTKLRRVGFNHAGELAKAVAKRLRVPYKEELLWKSEGGAAQHTLSRGERAENVRVLYHASRRLTGGTILLVDDIRTTGATLAACTAQLRGAGAERVYCATALLGQHFAPRSPGRSGEAADSSR